ncbi:helix-turn-helix domain-containing protein [Streptomyces sp. 3MP-14]|uniref:Helix-turn-helix domain-containing protein n=1 Tax=Streptomyces mimosae TaxID=2586635 RepID=A0A5N5ZQX8_9ACTN|nr:helix-turn-helix transcriptional regulator [Streptomyces sp. 3MP-14]KAB8158921.1 helix-turn-helix domain-containing protein [Streptomyces mimosae]KAB8175032.1 helix-turn-helix domain-containing protein [Streptomyces sp. 3MP-14]
MPPPTALEVGRRIAHHRRIARMTQQQLADAAGLGAGTLRKIERGARGASDAVLDAIADALGIDVTRLHRDPDRAADRVHDAMPTLRAVLACWDDPDDGPVRSLAELRAAVAESAAHRLGAQYLRIMRTGPGLLVELLRTLHATPAGGRQELARLAVAACRSVDAVAYKYRALDASGRLLDLMRSLTPLADDPITNATVAYVRTEAFFAGRAHAAGLRALERAIDAALPPASAPTAAARAALHMRAAVIAGRAADHDAATEHMRHAEELADRVPEGVYDGTAVGPDSVRIHEVSLAVSLGDRALPRALEIAREWAPPKSMPAERRSAFYIELSRAQLWAGQPADAFESLKVARRIAPQHAREHRWVREDVATLRRLRRADAESLSAYAEWCGAG